MNRHRLLILFVSVSACGGNAARDAEGIVVRDSAGVEIVENSQTGVWGAAPPTVEEVVRIGVVEGEEHLQFFQVYSVAVAQDGTIFVGNNQTGTVRVFTPDGTFLREFGGKGGGPDEFSMVNRVWLAGDSVVITDWQRGGKHGLFTREGELLESWTSTLLDGGRLEPRALTPDGWIADYNPRYQVPPLAPGEKYVRPNAIVRFDPSTNVPGDTLFMLPGRVLYGSPATEGLDWALFDPPTPSAFDAQGNLYISLGEPYRIEMYQPIRDAAARKESGRAFRMARVITRDVDFVPITEEDIAELEARLAERYDTMTSQAAEQRNASRDRVIRRIHNQRSFNPRPYLPPLRRMFVSHDGSFWVERADIMSPADLEYERLYGGFSRAVPRATRWDLFDAEGRYLTTVDLHARFTPHAVRGLEVTGVLKDELEVEYVVTYRVSPAQGDS